MSKFWWRLRCAFWFRRGYCSWLQSWYLANVAADMQLGEFENWNDPYTAACDEMSCGSE